MITEDTIWEETKKGNLDVLNSPLVDKITTGKMQYFDGVETPLHYLAQKGVLDVLKHPSVDKVKNWFGSTSLHLLAKHIKHTNILLKHPSVDKVFDTSGRTPLHILSEGGAFDVLEHPSIDKIWTIPDKKGIIGHWALGPILPDEIWEHLTPLHYFVKSTFAKKHPKIVRHWALKKYPWFPLGNRSRVTTDVVDKILNTQNAEKFILDICK